MAVMQWTVILLALVAGVSRVQAGFCGDPDANVTKSDFGNWRCGLFIMNAQGSDMDHVHTMQKLPGTASNARCADDGLLSNPDDWDVLSEKCQKFMTHGLKGDFRLDRPLPSGVKGSNKRSDTRSARRKKRSEDDSNKDEVWTIGDELCNTIIKKHICGYRYAYCLSTCGGQFQETSFTGPEPICCKQVGKTKFVRVLCSEWRPFIPGRPVPEICRDIVNPDYEEATDDY